MGKTAKDLSFNPAVFAILTGLLPIVATHAAYLISIRQGFSPTCFPYLDGCTSISAASREGDALFVFRIIVIFAAAMIVGYWLLVQGWLKVLGKAAARKNWCMVWLGLTGALFLALYANYLGSDGEFYRFLRRFGIILFFGLTPLAQMLLVRALFSEVRRGGLPQKVLYLLRLKLSFCLLMLFCGLTSVAADWLLLETRRLDNALEWLFALIIFSFFIVTGLIWRRLAINLALEL